MAQQCRGLTWLRAQGLVGPTLGCQWWDCSWSPWGRSHPQNAELLVGLQDWAPFPGGLLAGATLSTSRSPTFRLLCPLRP